VLKARKILAKLAASCSAGKAKWETTVSGPAVHVHHTANMQNTNMTDAEIHLKNWNRYNELLDFFDCFTPEQETEFLKICTEIAIYMASQQK
jgi:hypothetical protein